MSDYILVNKELYHHGIKGMKWGVRRFQEKDGSLTPAGKKRYSDGGEAPKKMSAHRVGLEKRYMDKGMSAEEAKAAADKRIKVEKVVAATAALTVAACAAYYAKNKYTQTYCDQVLKAGTTFHNLDSTANHRPDQHLYVNYRQNDINYFRGHFAVGKMRKTGSVFNHTITINEDIKIPSINTRKNVFKQLYDSDPEFRETFKSHSRSSKSANAEKVYSKMWRKFGDKDDPEFNVAKRKYFDALRQKGYDAIVDEWDTSSTVFRSDAPLILLNTSSKSFGEMSIKELTNRDILLAQANSSAWQKARSWKNFLGAPHTNHFEESGKYLSKYASKSAKNAKYIDKYLEKEAKLPLAGLSQKQSVEREDGRLLAEAGKYLSRHENMTVQRALKIARKKESAIDFVDSNAAWAVAVTPFIAAQRVSNDRYVKRYLEEHPNTTLTYNEIIKMKKREQRGY